MCSTLLTIPVSGFKIISAYFLSILLLSFCAFFVAIESKALLALTVYNPNLVLWVLKAFVKLFLSVEFTGLDFSSIVLIVEIKELYDVT